MDWAGFTAAVCVCVCVWSEDGLSHIVILDETHKSTSNRRHSPYLPPLCMPGRFGRDREKKRKVCLNGAKAMCVIKTLQSFQHTDEPHTPHPFSSGAGQHRVSSHGFWGVFLFVFIRNSPNYPKHRLSKVLEMFPEDLSADSKAIKPRHISLHHSSFKRSPALLKITFLLENLRAAENIQDTHTHARARCWAHYISKCKEVKDLFPMELCINCGAQCK